MTGTQWTVLNIPWRDDRCCDFRTGGSSSVWGRGTCDFALISDDLCCDWESHCDFSVGHHFVRCFSIEVLTELALIEVDFSDGCHFVRCFSIEVPTELALIEVGFSVGLHFVRCFSIEVLTELTLIEVDLGRCGDLLQVRRQTKH